MPIQMHLLGHIPDAHGPTPPPHKPDKPLRGERVVGQPGQPLPFHLAAPSTGDAPHRHFQVHPRIPAGEVPDTPRLAVVRTPVYGPAIPAHRFFLPPLQPDNPGLRIAKYPRELGLRTTPREAVDVQQSPGFSHPAILPKFSRLINLVFPCQYGLLGDQTPRIYPLTFTKSPSFVEG